MLFHVLLNNTPSWCKNGEEWCKNGEEWCKNGGECCKNHEKWGHVVLI